MKSFSTLSSDERLRYERQLILPEIGEDGQKELRDAKVFIAGLGGLGSVSAYYMAAAGIGHLRIADRDHVTLGNLNRQILHQTGDMGRPKAESAMETLQAVNPHCQIQGIQEDIRDDSIMDILGDCTIILDATDNAETRRVLNRASVSRNIPFIYGGVNGFNGMVSTFVPDQTPCFECLFPQKANGKTSESPIPALGPVAGLVASIQSLEVIKLILGMDGLLKGELLHIRGADMRFRKISISKNPECAYCHADKGGHDNE